MATTRTPRRRPRAPAAAAGARQLALFAAAYLVYFGVRAVTQGSADRAVENAWAVIRFERDVGIAWEGAIQRAVIGSDVLVDAANAVYMYGHWPAIVAAGVLLFRYRRPHYYRLRDACILSGIVGLVIFGLFPVAPPRLLDLPVVDTVTREASGYRQIVPPSLVNEYAAMPSFHAGWNLLVGVVVAGATRHPLLRLVAAAVPAAMVIAVVVTANHFVLDVVVGIVIALAALHVRDSVAERRAARPTLDADERRRDAHGPERQRHGAVPDRAPRRQRPREAATRAGARTAAG